VNLTLCYGLAYRFNQSKTMAKGYWIVRLNITQLEPFQAYIAANGAALA
jgi:hypothetical protein